MSKQIKTLNISKDANINYLAKIVELKQIIPHPDKDTTKLQIAIVDFEEVVIGKDMQVGDVCVFFRPESQISEKFLSHINAFRHSELNQDKDKTGFFEDSGRVRTVRLRKQLSAGFLVPIDQLEDYSKMDNLRDLIGTEFDSIGDEVLVKKYIIKTKESVSQKDKQGKKPKVSRLIDGQVHFHIDTQNLKYNATKISPDDTISITRKLHGTSGWASNVLTKKKLNIIERLLQKLGCHIIDEEYDLVYGSRRVVKNGDEISSKQHFYDEDIWGTVAEQLKEFIPKGFTLYYEIVGFTKSGSAIQRDYDYGCGPINHDVYIYRITQTNKDGFVTELSTEQMQDFCKRANLKYVPLYFFGKAKDWKSKDGDQISVSEHWNENFIQCLMNEYLEKTCELCVTKAPDEGIVLRKELLFSFEAYKLKSAAFLAYETKLLDEGVADMESNQ